MGGLGLGIGAGPGEVVGAMKQTLPGAGCPVGLEPRIDPRPSPRSP
jgi:hypothetical protein